MIETIGFHLVTRVSKSRREYKKDSVTVALDEVDDVGLFVEIEVMCQEEEIRKGEREICDVAKMLNLDDSNLEKRKYDQLVGEQRQNNGTSF
jgi:predicted adenylyl cyclase CyaB